MFVVLLTTLIAVVDQATKHAVRSRFVLGEQVPVIPGFFNLVYVRNTGAAWGMMAGLNHVLIALSAGMLIVLVVFRRSILADTRVHRVALASMLAGIVGNLIDRIRLGYVVDFLDFGIRGAHFPAFNVADAAICTGMGLYLLTQFLEERRRGAAGGAPP